jgi:radical SAM protein with 4Fe4S-binding SPASM domain
MKYQLKVAVIEITKICNLRCVHCGSGCTDILGKELSIKDWESVISTLPELGVEKVIFSGGEPTTKKGIEILFSRIKELGMDYGMITNGFKMSAEMIFALAKYKPFAVGFSVDGLEETHNKIRQNQSSWQNCLASMKHIKNDAELPICMVTTVNKWNYGELDGLAALADSVGADCWQLQLTFPSGRAKEQTDFLINEEMFAEIFEKIAKFRKQYPRMRIEAADCFTFAPAGLIRDDDWFGCQAGITSIGIDAFGDVMPCLAMRAAAVCGNVKEIPLKKIWENSDKLDFNRKFNPDAVVGNCRDCQALVYCRGGCGSFSLSYNGHFHDAPFCYFRNELKNVGGR